jgi:hypothetical protein
MLHYAVTLKYLTSNVENTVSLEFFLLFSKRIWQRPDLPHSRLVQTNTKPHNKINNYFRTGTFFPWHTSPQWTRTSSILRLHDCTQTHRTWYDSSGAVISPTYISMPDDKQHSQETDTHAPGGIRTRNRSKRAAADPRLRPRGHWDRQNWTYSIQTLTVCNFSAKVLGNYGNQVYVVTKISKCGPNVMSKWFHSEHCAITV